MDKKYNISVTFEDLQAILVNKFGLSEEKAQIVAVALIHSQVREQQTCQKQLNEETLLFLGGDSEKHQTHIFSTRYTICFSNAMIEILDNSIIPIIMALLGKSDLAALNEILCGIKTLLKNCRRIKDNECCVYFQTLKYLKTNKSRWFSADQIMPDIGEEQLCVNLDKDWECRFRTGPTCENCSLTLETVKEILEGFCEDSVMEANENDSSYRFRT